MILRGGERNSGRAVAEREERSLFAVEKFFDDQFGAGLAEAAAEHHVDRDFGLGEGFRHDHAFAGGEPVGLDDDRRAAAADIGFGRSRVEKRS